MLDFLRRSAGSWVVKGLLLLLIASFAVWGIGDIFRNNSGSQAVASVGKTDISMDRFRAEFVRELDRVGQILGQPISREQAFAMGVDGMLMNRLVSAQVMQEGAKDFGLLPSDAVVLSAIKDNPEFKNEAGEFDRRVFTEVLSRAGMNEAMYVARVRESLARQQFLSPIADGAMAPAILVDTLYKRIAETRVLDVVRITHAKVKSAAAPTDAELATYHSENAARFMAPEYRALTAVVLSADDMAKTIDVSAEELAQAYEARAEEFATPEVRTLSQILVKDEIAAGRAVELLDGGKSVAEAAQEVGANVAMTQLGKFTRDEAAALSTDIADAAFSTPKGGHSKAVKSPLGWHVLVVDDVTPGVVQTLDDVKEQLLQHLRGERALDVLFEASNQLQDSLGGGQTLEEAAASVGVKAIKLAAVDAQGLTPAGTPAAVPYIASIVAKGFELNEGTDSLMSESEDGKAFFVVRADGVTPPALRPLDTIKTQVAALWMQDQQATRAAQIAEDVKARLAAGEDAKAVAAALGFDAFTTEPFNRLGQGLEQGALPATLMQTVFTLKPGEVAMAQGTGAHSVARLKTVTAVVPDAANALYRSLHDRTLQDLQGDLATQLSAALQQRHPVTINQAALADFTN